MNSNLRLGGYLGLNLGLEKLLHTMLYNNRLFLVRGILNYITITNTFIFKILFLPRLKEKPRPRPFRINSSIIQQ
jgi:hypothetical protein